MWQSSTRLFATPSRGCKRKRENKIRPLPKRQGADLLLNAVSENEAAVAAQHLTGGIGGVLSEEADGLRHFLRLSQPT